MRHGWDCLLNLLRIQRGKVFLFSICGHLGLFFPAVTDRLWLIPTTWGSGRRHCNSLQFPLGTVVLNLSPTLSGTVLPLDYSSQEAPAPNFTKSQFHCGLFPACAWLELHFPEDTRLTEATRLTLGVDYISRKELRRSNWAERERDAYSISYPISSSYNIYLEFEDHPRLHFLACFINSSTPAMR